MSFRGVTENGGLEYQNKVGTITIVSPTKLHQPNLYWCLSMISSITRYAEPEAWLVPSLPVLLSTPMHKYSYILPLYLPPRFFATARNLPSLVLMTLYFSM